MMSEVKCGTCHYWMALRDIQLARMSDELKKKIDDSRKYLQGHGNCRRYAPSPSFDYAVVGDKNEENEEILRPHYIIWPLTGKKDWCGDWKAKEA
jgi:hypothetical protein